MKANSVKILRLFIKNDIAYVCMDKNGAITENKNLK